MMIKRILVLTVLTMLAVVPAALAGKSNTRPTLTASPTAPVVGDNLVFAGCNYPTDGYPKIKETGLDLTYPSGVTRSLSLNIAADGCFTTAVDGTPFPATEVGMYTATIFQYPHLAQSPTLVFTVG